MRAPAHPLAQWKNARPASSGVTGLNNSEKTLNQGAATICAIARTRASSTSRRVLVTTKAYLLVSVEMKPQMVCFLSRVLHLQSSHRASPRL
jgi:hypothetical protein